MPENTDKLLNRWGTSTEEAIETLQGFSNLMAKWQRARPSKKQFFAMLKKMRNAGLEDWLDGHPLGLDALAEKLEVE